MKKKIICLLTAFMALTSVPASAAWNYDVKGWRYNNNNSYVTGWKSINEKWYYFGEDGYMLHDCYVDGYGLNSEGACIINESGITQEQAKLKVLDYLKVSKTQLPTSIENYSNRGNAYLIHCYNSKTQINTWYYVNKITGKVSADF